MKLDWKKPIAECETIGDLTGIDNAIFNRRVEEFKVKLENHEIKNSGELMMYAGEVAETTEEAIVLTSIFTSVVSQRRRNPLEEMIAAAMAGRDVSDDEDEVEESHE